MSKDDIERVKAFERAGLFRALLFLRDGERKSSDFMEVMSFHTFRDVSKVLLEFGWIKEGSGEHHRARTFFLTEQGRKALEYLDSLLKIIDNPS